MTPEEFKNRMAEIADGRDREEGHVIADDLLCDVLIQLGYDEGVTIYSSMDKWYA